MGDLRIGVDLGGTKTEAVVVRLGGDAPEILARKRVPTGRDEGYEHILGVVSGLVRDVAREAGSEIVPVGVGLPGSVTRAGLVKNANTTCLIGRPFIRDLESELQTKVAFANDANCFALAEAIWGAARGARVAFGVIMGTGVGGGIVLDGRAWDGVQGIAGEWGHMVLEPVRGPPCYCGKRGCVETYLSGPAIEAAWKAQSGRSEALADLAAFPEGHAFLVERTDWFGRALANVLNVLDPEVVVLGGGVSNLGVLYTEGVAAVKRWIFDDHVEARIVKHELGDSAGVLGAALLPGA